MLVAQLVLIGAILMLARTDPSSAAGLWWTVFWAVVVAFASATQDIAIDAYRTAILEEELLGAGAAHIVFGSRVAMLAGGGGDLLIAGLAGWFLASAALAALGPNGRTWGREGLWLYV